jgi:hypothetical protein
MLVLASLRTGIFTVECACPEPFRLKPTAEAALSLHTIDKYMLELTS